MSDLDAATHTDTASDDVETVEDFVLPQIRVSSKGNASTLEEDRKDSLLDKNHGDQEGSRSPEAVFEYGYLFKGNSVTRPERRWVVSQFETDLIRSLDRLNSSDLATHLYSTFKLKNKSSIDVSADSDDSSSNDGGYWVPRKIWTAWPLPPENVPRDAEGFPSRSGTALLPSFPASPSKASLELEDALKAQVMRAAKLQLEQRVKQVKQLAKDQEHNGISDTKHDKERFNHVGARTALGRADLDDVVSANDDEVAQILITPVRGMLAQLDKLLQGLHIIRKAVISSDPPVYKAKAASKRRPSNPTSRSRSRNSTSKTSRSVSRRRRAVSTSSAHSAISATSSRPQKESRKYSSSSTPLEKFVRRKVNLSLHDWNDVLGVASLSGIDPDTIDRARNRCNALFGQGLDLETLLDTKNGSDIVAQHRSNWSGTPKVDAQARQRYEEMSGGVHLDGFLQPV